MTAISKISGVRFPTTLSSTLPFDTVREAVAVQAEAGINYPTTGIPIIRKMEQSMHLPFLEAFEGYEVRRTSFIPDLDKFAVKSREAISELEVVKEVTEACNIVAEYKNEGKYDEFIGLKAALCGPTTIFKRAIIADEDSSDHLLTVITDGLGQIAELMIEQGAIAVQLDDPEVASFHSEIVINSLTRFFRHLKMQKEKQIHFLALHVCRGLTRELFTLLARIPDLDVLDVEMARREWQEDNFQNIDKSILDMNDTNLAIGIVTSLNEVDSPNDVNTVVRRAIMTFAPNTILLKPDCGLRRLASPELAATKLQQVQKAREEALKSFE